MPLQPLGDRNSSHLFERRSGVSPQWRKKVRLTWRACPTRMKYGMHCCFGPKPINYSPASVTQVECDANVKKKKTLGFLESSRDRRQSDGLRVDSLTMNVD